MEYIKNCRPGYIYISIWGNICSTKLTENKNERNFIVTHIFKVIKNQFEMEFYHPHKIKPFWTIHPASYDQIIQLRFFLLRSYRYIVCDLICFFLWKIFFQRFLLTLIIKWMVVTVNRAVKGFISKLLVSVRVSLALGIPPFGFSFFTQFALKCEEWFNWSTSVIHSTLISFNLKVRTPRLF